MGDCGVQVNATTLAQRLGVSKARISQYVAQGTLAGCFTGEGRARVSPIDRRPGIGTRERRRGPLSAILRFHV